MSGRHSDRKRKTLTILRITTQVIELIPNLIFIAIYGVAMLSPYVSPAKTQVPAFLNLAFGVILAALLILWVMYLIRRKWIYFGIYSTIMLLSSSYIFAYFPINIGKNLSGDNDFRVMTYNAMSFLGRDDNDNVLAPDMIRGYRPDIVALQEANYYPDDAPVVGSIKRLLKDYPYVHVHKSQAFASKYPIIVKKAIEYNSYRNGSFAYLISVPEHRKVLVINNHMQSYSLNTSEREEYKTYLKDLSLRDLPHQFMAVKRRLGPQLSHRGFTAERVHAELDELQVKCQPDLTIVLGDLNDTPMSYTYSQLRNGMRDAFVETGFGLGITFNDRWMPFRIDHLFYEGSAKAVGSSIPNYKNHSDHNPLIVDFKWE